MTEFELKTIEFYERFSFEEMELNGMNVKFTPLRIDRSIVPEGLYAYDIRADDYDIMQFCTIEENVTVNHTGTIIVNEELEIPEKGYIQLEGCEKEDYIDFYSDMILMGDYTLEDVPDEFITAEMCIDAVMTDKKNEEFVPGEILQEPNVYTFCKAIESFLEKDFTKEQILSLYKDNNSSELDNKVNLSNSLLIKKLAWDKDKKQFLPSEGTKQPISKVSLPKKSKRPKL